MSQTGPLVVNYITAGVRVSLMATVPPGCEKDRRYDIIILTIGVMKENIIWK